MDKGKITLISLLIITCLGAGGFLAYKHFNKEEEIVHDLACRYNTIKKPDFSAIDDVKKKKAIFFTYMMPHVANANTKLLLMRNKIETGTYTEEEIIGYCNTYKVDCSSNITNNLLDKINMIPPSIALAQAALESGWGTSRFAVEGNNYFGQWCYEPGCGLVPEDRPTGKSHEVKVFESPQESIMGYMTVINANDAYQKLKDARKSDPFNIAPMVNGLSYYSQKRWKYVNQVKQLIEYNNLTQFDEKYKQFISSNSGNPECAVIRKFIEPNTAQPEKS